LGHGFPPGCRAALRAATSASLRWPISTHSRRFVSRRQAAAGRLKTIIHLVPNLNGSRFASAGSANQSDFRKVDFARFNISSLIFVKWRADGPR